MLETHLTTEQASRIILFPCRAILQACHVEYRLIIVPCCVQAYTGHNNTSQPCTVTTHMGHSIQAHLKFVNISEQSHFVGCYMSGSWNEITMSFTRNLLFHAILSCAKAGCLMEQTFKCIFTVTQSICHEHIGRTNAF